MSQQPPRRTQPLAQDDEFELKLPPAGQSHAGSMFGKIFNRFAKWASRATGDPFAFCLAATVVLVWGLTGPLFGYSDTWQLVINTGTTIITFLMVFLIQNTQNRDAAATQIKLDELIRALSGAHNALLDLEELEERELEEVRLRYERLAQRSRELLRQGETDSCCGQLPEAVLPGDESNNPEKSAAAS